MRNLKRFRSWIALVAAVAWNYLQQLGTRNSKAAEERPNNATPQTSRSSGGVAAQQAAPAPKAVAKPAAVLKPGSVAHPDAPFPGAKAIDVPAKVPVVQVTAEITAANGKAHQSAQRLARVLISEIKLYYLNKIEGQDAAQIQNIYDLLKGPIDKSRQHYDQRVAAEEPMPDYFHGELVKTLCAGDASRLGPNYKSKRA